MSVKEIQDKNPRMYSSDAKRIYAQLREKERTKEKNALIAMTTDSAVDKYSRAIFPIAFMVFNIVYWIVYLQKKNSILNDDKTVHCSAAGHK